MTDLAERGLSAEQKMMRESCRAFVDDFVTPFIRQNWQREWLMAPEDRLPKEILEQADRIGIRTLAVPEEFGGVQLDPASEVQTFAIISEEIAKVCTSLAGSSCTPPNSSGTASVRMPILSACSRISLGSRSSGAISHSRCQFCRMNGVTKSSTKARQLSRIIFC